MILDYVPQPDDVTCQSACIAKVLGTNDVFGVRRDLEDIMPGGAGSPQVMGQYLEQQVNEYKFDPFSSLQDMVKALKEDYTLITHGYFTASGHVICIVDYEIDPHIYSYKFICDDPYGEFFFKDWKYYNDKGNDVRYSSYGIYATCVASDSVHVAQDIYARRELNDTMKNAWVHYVKN